ncbi:Thymidylate synthase [Candidatus Methanoperedenaceae archaeon GB50]|nr:MAG: thymidylate synthase [Methanosarcinales archaeon]CAD7771410.1 MAG: Thymidylate synthase [Candidatus Methanoperedenaceae archaeon GB50]CAD7772467.1 Thymidylate synthase [Candidatus Methanoperedenaceae archaeon GB37]CAD7772579.1 Thymidylate synthase [Candidatus Methanoperedenaceae archaeon GB50]
MKIYILYKGGFGKRLLGHLTNERDFCTGCAHLCTHCRDIPELDYSNDIIGIHSFAEGLPEFIDDVSEFLPEKIPVHDVTIAINMHPDIIAALPSYLSKFTQAIIAPVEVPRWVSPGLRSQLESECASYDLEFAAPKPFCVLEGEAGTVINEFTEHFKIGRPLFEITRYGEIIGGVRVIRSHPCGCAYFVAQKLRGESCEDLDALNEVISGAHHSYPCTASMHKDVELGDTILHYAGYITRKAVYEALGITQ